MTMTTPLHPGMAMSLIADELMMRKPLISTASFARPADTTQYAINDIIFPAVPVSPAVQIKALRFPNAIPAGSAGFVVDAQLKVFSAQVTKLSAELHLFTKLLAVAPVDNAPFAVGTNVSLIDMASHLKTISFPNSVAVESGTFTLYEVVPSKVVVSDPASTDLYGILVARNAYTPISGEQFVIQLGILPRASIL